MFRKSGESPVLSLAVRAAAGTGERKERTQFTVLVRHIFARFFDNDLISLGDEVQVRIAQTAAAVGLPGLIWVMMLSPSYHQPIKKPFWPQAADHYFFVTYTFVVMGVFTVFESDALFPDLLDAFVLTTLPIAAYKLFLARISALGLLLGVFLFATGALESIFLCLWYWTMSRSTDVYSPGYFGHLGPHLAAVALSGIFASALIVALEGLLLNVLGERIFRALSPVLQSIAVALLLVIGFLFPLLSGFLPVLLTQGGNAVLWFPPFWFLGIYETLLGGPSAASIFHTLARTGCWATAGVIGLVALTYPLAYRRKMLRAVEGAPVKRTPNRLSPSLSALLNLSILRTPGRRAIYYFISQTLPRVERHRLFLAMYGGLGLSLVVSSAVALRVAHHQVALVLSPHGLRFAVPVVVFWTVSGLRTTLTSPMDRRGSWIFRAINGRPGRDHLAAARLWVLLRAGVLTALAIVVLRALAPAEFEGAKAIAAQCIAGFALCLLLVDLFFMNVLMIPFTAPRVSSTRHLALLLPAYLVLFPWLVWTTVEQERWLTASIGHLAFAVLLIAALDCGLRWLHRRSFDEDANLLPIEDEEAWPPRLGLE